MRIGIYFYNLYDLIYAARKIKDLGLSCRVAIGSLNKEEYGNYYFILRLLDKNTSLVDKDEIRIIYSGKEFFSSAKNLEAIKSIKKEKEKVIFFMGDVDGRTSVLGGYIIFFTPKGEGYSHEYLPEYMRSIWKEEEIAVISKNVSKDKSSGDALNNELLQLRQGIIFDCRCKREILELIKEHNISIYDSIFVGGFDLIESIYSRTKEYQLNNDNYIIVSSSKNTEELSLLRELIHEGNVEDYCLNPYTLLVNPKEEKERAISFLTYKQNKRDICLATAINPEDVINLNEIAVMLNIAVEEIKNRIDEELIEVASILIKRHEGVKCIVSLKASTAFSLAKALGLRGLQYNKEITSKWTCLSGELEERKIDFLINMKDSEEEISLQEVLTKYFIML